MVRPESGAGWGSIVENTKARATNRATLALSSFTCPRRAEVTPLYALNELPHPQVVLAWGFLIEKPDPCTLST